MPDADRTRFGVTPDGEVVERVTLRNAGGMQVDVITLGASLQGVQVPDREGRLGHVLLGHETLEPYVRQPHFMGACVGRYANRIGGAAFSLDGRPFHITANEGANALHGGVLGLDKVVWRIRSADQHQVVLRHVSPDGDQGFPGELTITATYRLDPGVDQLDLILEAVTDASTVVSLAPHGYFNLAGADGDRDVMDHTLTLAASAYTPVDEGLIPTGEIRPVDDTPFDFRTARRIGDRVRDAHDPQIRIGRGYDHNFVLDDGRTDTPTFAARLVDPSSGRSMVLLTTEPGLQFYSGNFLTGALIGRDGAAYGQGQGLCLESQNFPDAPNQPGFPSSRLDPGQTYRHHTIWRFSSDNQDVTSRTGPE
ncbi:MAG: aldose epimerase family protein [Brevundimonas sp.]|uniref:aldose epimerase family protein n=1 Tax=Brevundimonas sp. TaxID=1871086 RepID=UPI00391C48BD